MRVKPIALLALPLALAAGFFSLDPDLRGLLLTAPSGPDVLSWSLAQRDAGFRALDKLPILIKHREAAPSPTPRALPAGKPLVVPGLDDYFTRQRIAGMVLLQDGKIRLERYGLGFSASGKWASFSVAKSFTSTLIGAAVADGAIKSLDEPVTRYLPALIGSGYDGVTLYQLMTMSSGVAWNEDYANPNSDVARFNDAPAEAGLDPILSYMRKLPRAHAPGTVWHYNTGETNLIGTLLEAAIHKPLTQYLHEKIWVPAGMEGRASWLLNAGGHEIAGCCIQAATRDYARFGQFVMEGGHGVVPANWFATATSKQKDIGEAGHGYGLQWWTFDDGSFAAIGIFGQSIFIDPARKLVIATNGDWVEADADADNATRETFFHQIQHLLDQGA